MSLVHNDPWAAGVLSPLAWLGEGILNLVNPKVIQSGAAYQPFDWSDPFGYTISMLVPDIDGPLGFVVDNGKWIIIGSVVVVGVVIVTKLLKFIWSLTPTGIATKVLTS
jgi:hypothetical protein